MNRFLLSVLVVASTASTAYANDSIARVAAGGLTLLKSHDVSMIEEVLEISKKQVRVHYRFQNETNDDIRTKVAFPMPPYRWDFERPYVGPLKDFSVTAGGVQIVPQRLRRALLKKRDITEKLRAIGLSDTQIFENFGGECNSPMTDIPVGCDLSEKQRKEIAHLLGQASYYPIWEVEETYYWDQTFPAGKELEVQHQYSPFVGGRYAYPYWEGKKQEGQGLPYVQPKEACVDDSTAQAVNRKVRALIDGGSRSVRVDHSDIEYILGTGRNWKGPIGKFTLRIQKASPDEIVSLCMVGKPKKIDGATIEFTQLQFVPQDRLVVYFYSATAN